MTRRVLGLSLGLLLGLGPAVVQARGHGGHGGGTHSASHSSKHSGGHLRSGAHHSGSTHSHSSWLHAGGSHRTSHGKFRRDPEQRRAFMRTHPCPSTGKTSGACPGYVVDHRTPLKRGGVDSPDNMQWQTVQDAKAKDKRE